MAKEQNKEIEQYNKSTSQINDNLASASQHAQNLSQSMIIGNRQIKKMGKGLQQSSRALGGINTQVVDFTKNLSRTKSDYKDLQGAAKKWANSMDFKRMTKQYEVSINRHKGLFTSVYTSINQNTMKMAKSFKTLGKGNFSDMTMQLQSLDNKILDIMDTITDPGYDSHLFELKSAQLQNIIEYRDNLYDVNKAQVLINQKTEKMFSHFDKAGQKLNDLKNGMSGFFSLVNLAIPGLGQAFNKLDFNIIFDEMKTASTDMLMSVEMGFEDSAESGKGSFSKVFTTMKLLAIGTSKAMVGIFKRAFQSIALAGVAIGTAMFKIAFDRSMQVQNAIIDIHKSTNLLVGQVQDMDHLFQLAGGIITNISLADLINQVHTVNDITDTLVSGMYSLERNLGITSDTSAEYLTNLKYIAGYSDKQAVSMAQSVGNMATMAGLIPNKLFKQLANASDTVYANLSNNPKQLAKANIFAKKLGLSLQSMASFSQGMWDFESKIGSAMEVQALTGLDVPIERMLQLNASGDVQGAMGLALQSLGKDFDKQSPIIKKKIAQLTGLSVTQFSKASKVVDDYHGDYKALMADLQSGKLGMSSEQLQAQKLHDTFGEISQIIKQKVFKALGQVIDKIKEFVSNDKKMQPLIHAIGKFANALGTLLMTFVKGDGIMRGVTGALVGLFNVLNGILKVVNFLGPVASGGIITVLLLSKVILGLNSAIKITSNSFKLMGLDLKGVGKGFINVIKNIKDYIKNLIAVRAANKATIASEKTGMFGKLGKLFSKNNSTGSVGKSVAKGATNIGQSTKDVGNIPKSLKPKQMSTSGASMIKFAAAILILSAALWVVSKVAQGGRLMESVVAIGALSGVMMLITKFAETGQTQSAGVILMSTSIAILAGALWLVGQIDTGRLFSSIGAMVLAISAFAGIAILLGSGPIPAFAGIGTIIIIGLAGAMLLMTTAALIFSNAITNVGNMLIKIVDEIDPVKLTTLGGALVLFSGSIQLASVGLLSSSLSLIPAGAALYLGLSALNISLNKLSSGAPVFKSFGQGLSLFTKSIVQFGQNYLGGSISSGVDGLKQTVEEINGIDVKNKNLKLDAKIQTNSIDKMKTDYTQVNKSTSKTNELFLQQLRKIANRAIQVTIKLDGKKIGKQLINNSDVSMSLG